MLDYNFPLSDRFPIRPAVTLWPVVPVIGLVSALPGIRSGKFEFGERAIMNDVIDTELCVIGAGSGGLNVAAGAAQMGASVVLIEKGKMGGDCLNYGCVPPTACSRRVNKS